MTTRFNRRHLRPVTATVRQTAFERGRCDKAEGLAFHCVYIHCDDRDDYARGYHAPVDPAARRTVLGPPPSTANRYAKLAPRRCRNSGQGTR